MGVFKDGFKAVKGAKELGDYHGGMPSMRSSFKDIAKFTDDQGQGDILKHGVPTKAVVKGFPMQVDTFSMGIQLDVFPPEGGDPYLVDYTFPSARDEGAVVDGHGGPGQGHGRRPDGGHGAVGHAQGFHRRVGWRHGGGRHAGHPEHVHGRCRRGRDSPTGQEADAEAAAKVAANDPAERLESLSQLKDAGLVSDEEFETKKAEILADL